MTQPATRELAEAAARRISIAMVVSNAAGALVVFAFANAVLPVPAHLHHQFRLFLINGSVFVVAGTIAVAYAWARSKRLWETRFRWAKEDREPTELEREATLRYPISQTALNARLWAIAAIGFTALNAPFSLEAASDAAITTVLGGLVTCSSGYLLCERLTRPLTAIALSTGVPARPVLPGVAARTILTWTLGTGVFLLGVALIGVGGLHESVYTSERLSIAMVVLGALGLAVGLATMKGLADSLAGRIRELRGVLDRVGRGELDIHVEVDDGSEVGLLQAGFNQMVAGLRERERLRDLFGRQVGEDVVRHALDHGVRLGGEARDAAVLFVDLEGSTALAHSRDPAEVVSFLNAFFEIVVEVVEASGGWVNKFEGDAALCVWGAPLEDVDAATHALAAGLAMRDRFTAQGIAAGIGISAGRVVAGNIGAAKRFEYTVIGDAVNEAARLTELAKSRPGRLLVSDAALSRASAGEAARFELCDELVLRGRAAPTTVAAPRG
jgi:adenylate cyclase